MVLEQVIQVIQMMLMLAMRKCRQEKVTQLPLTHDTSKPTTLSNLSTQLEYIARELDNFAQNYIEELQMEATVQA